MSSLKSFRKSQAVLTIWKKPFLDFWHSWQQGRRDHACRFGGYIFSWLFREIRHMNNLSFPRGLTRLPPGTGITADLWVRWDWVLCSLFLIWNVLLGGIPPACLPVMPSRVSGARSVLVRSISPRWLLLKVHSLTPPCALFEPFGSHLYPLFLPLSFRGWPCSGRLCVWIISGYFFVFNNAGVFSDTARAPHLFYFFTVNTISSSGRDFTLGSPSGVLSSWVGNLFKNPFLSRCEKDGRRRWTDGGSGGGGSGYINQNKVYK